MMIQLKPVYEAPSSPDGVRFLVERLWPCGVKKSSLEISAWLKDVAPSADLRNWFHTDPARWDEFRRRYFAELSKNPASWRPILDAARSGHITHTQMPEPYSTICDEFFQAYDRRKEV